MPDGQGEKRRFTSDAESVHLGVGEIREQRETEFKILGDWEKRLKPTLKEMGAKKVFNGTITIWWFKNGLPRGMSARVKKAEDDDGSVEYIWTIKYDAERSNGSQPELIRDTFEREGREKSFGKAKSVLMAEVERFAVEKKLIQVPFPATRQTATFEIKKRRVSYVIKEGEFAGLRLDFDTFKEASGRKGRKKIEQIQLVEIEDTSDDDPVAKERRIFACALALGFTEAQVKTEFAPLSTEALLIRLGQVERRSVVSDKKPVPYIQDRSE